MNNGKTFSQVLNETGRLVYTISGFSMRPLLRQGKDVVVIEKYEGHCRKYDTVLFLRKSGKYVLHRILKVNGDKYWIGGDNCSSGEIVDEDQIIGVLSLIKRGNRTIKVTDWQYRLYTHIWCDAYPVRFALLRTKVLIRKGLSFVKRRLFV